MKKKIGLSIVGIIFIIVCAFGIYRWKLSITHRGGSEARYIFWNCGEFEVK